MATYFQWLRKSDIKRATYVCGAEQLLVEEVVDHIHRAVSPQEVDDIVLTAGQIKERDIWAALNQYPSGGKRLVVVRSAEKIKRWQPFVEWMQDIRLMPYSFVVFVSEDLKLDTEQPYQELLQKKGQLVCCSPLAEPEMLTWVQRRAGCSEATARKVLERTGGDLAASASVAMKLALFDDDLSSEMLSLVCSSVIANDFVDELVAMRRARALALAEEVPEEDISLIIGRLDLILTQLLWFNRALKKGKTIKEMARRMGKASFRIPFMLTWAKNYDLIAVTRRRQVLAVVDDALHMGVRMQDGLLEAVVALW